jgi:enoyl-CoA hydratase/carnithine racemase
VIIDKVTVPSEQISHGHEDTTVLLSRSDGIATITLNRPKQLNAINRKLIDELHAAVLSCEKDKEIVSIILTGRGRAFSAGDDIKNMPNEFVLNETFFNSVEKLQDISRLLVLGSKSVVAAVNGWAVGGGLSWVVNCDVAIMAEDTVCFFPEVSLGLAVTGGVSSLLPAAIGRARARSLLMAGRRIGAREALDYGLAAAVVPEADLQATALEQAKIFTALPALALAEARRVLNSFERDQFEEALAKESAVLRKLVSEMISQMAWPRIE